MYLPRQPKQMLSVCSDFEDVEVKQNAPELPEKALRFKRKKCIRRNIKRVSVTDSSKAFCAVILRLKSNDCRFL